tara:strand:- start:945 stop:1250 length:306 start_codon:yes stop_codon:yes gene_type:complete
MKKTIFLLLILSFVYSCGGLKDVGKVFKNEKVTSTDEFLVKKRNPLILPPNFEKIPEPGTLSSKKENDEEKIKKILNAPSAIDTSKNNSSIEKSILNKIRK